MGSFYLEVWSNMKKIIATVDIDGNVLTMRLAE
jgi:hypothetical protein